MTIVSKNANIASVSAKNSVDNTGAIAVEVEVLQEEVQGEVIAVEAEVQQGEAITVVVSPHERKENKTPLQRMGRWLLDHGLKPLPVCPQQDPFKYPARDTKGNIKYDKDGKPLPLFTGKNPSYLDENDIPQIIKHSNYFEKQPTDEELKRWFANKANGIGTLGTNFVIWVDWDTKNFDYSVEDCKEAFFTWLEKYPQLKVTFLEITHSGGYRCGVRLQNKPEFTNFCIEPNGRQIGEALGYGRFTVLSPTIGVSGNRYANLNLPDDFVEVESLESIGIYPHKKTAELPQPSATKPLQSNLSSTKQTISGHLRLEELGHKKSQDILKGVSEQKDRSAALTTAIKEWAGWSNWLNSEGLPYSDSLEQLAHLAGTALGLDSEKINRILKSVDTSTCFPGVYNSGSKDISCWQKIRSVEQTFFESNCPEPLKTEVLKKKSANKVSVKSIAIKAAVQDDNIVETTVEEAILCGLFQDGEGDQTVLNDAFFTYSGKGFWSHTSDALVERDIAQKLRKLYKLVSDGAGGYERIYKFATEANKRNSFKFCRSALTQNEATYNDHLLAFKNGTVDLRTGQIQDHDPKNLLTSYLPVDYVPGAECPEIFRNFICDAYGEDLLPLIRAVTAMLLDPTAPFGYFVHVIGASGSGKGTLLRFWGSMFGEQHVRSLNSFTEIGKPEGRHQHLTGTKLVSFPDVGGHQAGLKAFYELIDNGSLSGRALFSNNGYEKKWGCRFILASVSHLSIENSGDGWDRRAIPLPTKIRRNEVDPDLGRKLQQVRGDVISWALSMPRQERDKLIMKSEQNKRIAELKVEQSIYSDSVKAFVDMTLRPSADPKATIENHSLHDWYVSFCKAQGFVPMSSTKFISHLKNVLPQNRVERRQYRENGQVFQVRAHWRFVVPIAHVFQKATNTNGLNPESTSFVCTKSLCMNGGLDEFKEFWAVSGVTGVTSTPPLPCDMPVTAENLAPQPFSTLSQASQASQGENSTYRKRPSLTPVEKEETPPPVKTPPQHQNLKLNIENSPNDACDACDSSSNPDTASVTGMSQGEKWVPVTPVTPVTENFTGIPLIDLGGFDDDTPVCF